MKLGGSAVICGVYRRDTASNDKWLCYETLKNTKYISATRGFKRSACYDYWHIMTQKPSTSSAVQCRAVRAVIQCNHYVL